MNANRHCSTRNPFGNSLSFFFSNFKSNFGLEFYFCGEKIGNFSPPLELTPGMCVGTKRALSFDEKRWTKTVLIGCFLFSWILVALFFFFLFSFCSRTVQNTSILFPKRTISMWTLNNTLNRLCNVGFLQSSGTVKDTATVECVLHLNTFLEHIFLAWIHLWLFSFGYTCDGRHHRTHTLVTRYQRWGMLVCVYLRVCLCLCLCVCVCMCAVDYNSISRLIWDKIPSIFNCIASSVTEAFLVSGNVISDPRTLVGACHFGYTDWQTDKQRIILFFSEITKQMGKLTQCHRACEALLPVWHLRQWLRSN